MRDIAIGELARRTGVKVPTIRYYEQEGLLPVPMRTQGQQRRYGTATVARLTFIRHARELGFEVAAVRELLVFSEQPDRPGHRGAGPFRRGPTLVNGLTLFGLVAVSSMLVTYTLEKRSHWYVLAFAASCAAGSAYGFMQGAWPFGLVEAVWSVVALRRWWTRQLL